MTPIGRTELVDKFTGKFNYNIPLFVIGDCPINIAYDASVSNGMEASWVGLGWTLNPGSINRIKRGLPDEFKGDIVSREVNRKPIERTSITMSETGRYKSDFNIWANSWKTNLLYDSELGWGTEVTKKRVVTVGISLPTIVVPGLSVGFSNMNLSERKASTFNGVTTTNADALSIGATYYVVGAGYMNTHSNSANSRYGLLNNTSYSGLNFNVLANAMKTHSTSVQSFVDPSYNPSANISYHTDCSFKDSKDGTTIVGFARGDWEDAFSSKQYIKNENKFISHKAYGYLNSLDGAEKNDVLMDVNREKDVPYQSNLPNIAIPSHTYDLFILNQQENGGQFRAYKNAVGFLKDPEFYSTSSSKSKSSEFFWGTFVEYGANIQFGSTITLGSSGIDFNNDIIKRINFNNKILNNNVQEKFYFKKTDELEEVDLSFNNTILNKDAASITLKNTTDIDNKFANNLTKNLKIFSEPVSKFYGIEKSLKIRPNSRNTYIIQRDFETKKNQSIDPEIYSYTKLADNNIDNIFSFQDKSISTFINYNDEKIKHHIAEFNVTNGDGKQYNYGIPIYNLSQEDVIFSAQENKVKDENDLVEYSGNDATINNSNGRDYFFNKEIQPKYPHTWLLTSITTPDYYDLTNNGLSMDDIGEATKINYTNFGKYTWRTPLDPKLKSNNVKVKALFNEGIDFETNDNKGIYSYGEREEWYAHSVESKTEIAYFILDDRKDAYPTNSEGNIIQTGLNKKQRLKKIVLYSKAELGKLLKENTNVSMNNILQLATPIKTIEFFHSYKLCPNTPNNINNYNNETINTGKLTLDSIRFYQGNNKISTSVYKFDYSSINPPYSMTNNDRWGNYKKDDDNSLFASNQNLKNSQFPYSVQEKNKANENATAWLLTKVTIPSGGYMKVDYESNTYSHVQDKRAATMYKIVGVGSQPNQALGSGDLYNTNSSFNNYLFFETNQSSGLTSFNVKDLFFGDNNNLDMAKKLYYESNFTLDVNKKQILPGYLEIEDIGLSNKLSNSKQVVWIKVKKYLGLEFHPMAVNAWQYVRDRLPDIAYDGFVRDYDMTKIKNFLEINKKKIDEGEDAFEKQAMKRNIAKSIDVNGKSWLRALIPNNLKYGGGNRVSKITISDEWDNLVNPKNVSSIKTPEKGEYTIDYEYTQPACSDQNVSTSGIATYEPMVGGSENPWRMPVTYVGQTNPEGPSSMYNLEKPFGELLFPSASIGYARIKETKNKSKISQFNTSEGFKVFEFYTAKDFPIETNNTQLESDITRRKEERLSDDGFDLLNLIGIKNSYTFRRQAASQGYSVILNDMHGKPKSELYFSHGQCDNTSPLNSTYYQYRPTTNLPTINNVGGISNKNFAENIDFTIDKRSILTTSTSLSIQPGFGLVVGFMLPPFKAWINTSSGTSVDQQYMNFISTSKVYRINNILDKVEVNREGAIYNTQNMLWDAKTQNAVLSNVNNEFGQTIYTYKPPAYWAYNNLSHSYVNQGVKFNLSTNTGSTYFFNNLNGEISGVNSILKDGDECLINYLQGSTPYNTRVHAYIENGPVYFSKRLIDVNGNTFLPVAGVSNYELTIVKSGSRNILSAPLTNLTFNDNPISGNKIKNKINNVLAASSIEYNDNWPYIVKNNYTNNANSINCFSGLTNNPFIAGNRTNLKSFKGYRIDGNRNLLTGTGSSPNVLTDGYSSISGGVNQFYIPDVSDNKFIINSGNISEWISNQTNTLYDKSGNLLENLVLVSRLKKCIGNLDPANPVPTEFDCCLSDSIYNSTKYGYLGLAPVVSVSNAKYNEIEFNSFEENLFTLPNVQNTVNDNLYNRLLPRYTLTGSPSLSDIAHTGNFSLKLTNVDANINSINCSESIIYPLDEDNSKNNYKYNYNLYKGRKYKINFWIKSTVSLNSNNPNLVDFEFIDNLTNPILVPNAPIGIIKTPKIEGWQLFEMIFNIPDNAEKTKIKLKSGTNGEIRYIDDLKLTPLSSNSSCFVYNHKNLKLMSELDENHFSTYYDYDESGNLIRLRKETEKGIITLKEINSNLRK